MTKILALHGYNGTPAGTMVQTLYKELNPAMFQITSPQLPLHAYGDIALNVGRTIDAITNALVAERYDIIVSKSLGSFCLLRAIQEFRKIATDVNLPRIIVINPVLRPVEALLKFNVMHEETAAKLRYLAMTNIVEMPQSFRSKIFGIFGGRDQIAEDYEMYCRIYGKQNTVMIPDAYHDLTFSQNRNILVPLIHRLANDNSDN